MPKDSPPDSSQADKERSKQMSRPVNAKSGGRQAAPARRSGPSNAAARATQQRASTTGRGPGQGGRGAGRGPGRNGQRPQPGGPSTPRRSPTSLLTWGAVVLVLVIVIVLVVVKITGNNTTASSGPASTLAPAAVVSEVTQVPASVYDAVGITSSVSSIDAPEPTTGQPLLTATSASGATLPEVYFFGAEYCPYCAAERWALIVSLSRFGTFKNLSTMVSSSTDVFPSTQTFTFYHSTYTSKYIVFRPEEYYSNQVTSSGTGYTIIQPFTGNEEKLVSKYDTTKFLPGALQTTADNGAFPFVDIGNKVLSSTEYAPSLLQGMTREEIAADLSDAKSPVTQAIVASANYLTAGICSVTKQAPAAVCTSKGVTAAAKALKVSIS
jgi:hypothetical protein